MQAETTALAVLLHLTRNLTEEMPLEQALRAITDAALELLGCEHASIRLLTDDGGELVSGARSGAGLEHKPVTFRRGEGVIGWVVDNAMTARVHDASADERFVPSGTSQGFAIGSILAIPLLAAGKVVGVLSAASAETSAFTEEHETLGRLLANCAVPAIDKARLERLAMTDYQTMAYSARYLAPRLTEEMERSERQSTPLSILLFDLDHFKRVNDAHGHAVGDRVLRAFCDRVREAVRQPDVLVRRGGEEFILIMPGADAAGAVAVAERVRERVARAPIEGGGIHVRQTASIGVATWDRNETPEELERRADLAMYEAKRAGRDLVVISEPPDAPADSGRRSQPPESRRQSKPP